jgi:hypothetical protein
MMRDMTEGPGQQQPPQEPRNQASDGRREVLEGRVIPSRTSDPRRSFSGPPQAQTPPQGQTPRQGQTPPPAQTPEQAQHPQPAQGAPQPPASDAGGPQAQPWAQSAQQPAQGGQSGHPGGRHGGRPDEAQFAARPGAGGGQQGFPQQAAQPPAGAPRGGATDPAPGTPDWLALAAEQETGARKRRIMMLVGGIVAVAVIAGGVATAVVMSGKSSSDKPIAGPSSSGTKGSQQPLPPAPSFSSVAPPPPANPLDYISSAAKDKAPVTAAGLFPGTQFVTNGRTYAKTNTATTSNCSAGARSSLAGALSAHGCTKLVRATYTNGKMAVTLGIAVFPDTAHAAKLQKVAQYVAPLNGGGISDFCHAVACQMTSNAVGRYAYFAIAGYKNGSTLPPTDTVARQAANEASNFAFQQIIQRGRDAAQADAKNK